MGDLSEGYEDITDQQLSEAMEELTAKWEAEEAKWKELGLNHPSTPGGYTPDLFLLACGFDLIKQILIEKGLIGQKELYLRHRTLMYESMVSIREAMEPKVEEMKRNSLIVRQMPPNLDNHKPPFEQ